MGISLYYIPGISRLDEPVFDTISNQSSFFDRYKVADVDTGFYPPHFRNSIRLEIDTDIDFTKSINYLSLDFNSKIYYYFIDNINYKNEGIIDLEVTMDTIQTFMFNINFVNSELDRCSIKRWNGTSINRDYIRENISNGMYKNDNFTKIELAEDRVKVLVIKYIPNDKFVSYTASTIPSGVSPFKTTNMSPAWIENSTSDNISFDGYNYLIIPIPTTKEYGIYSQDLNISYHPQMDTYFHINFLRPLRNLLETPYVENAVLTTSKILEDLGYTMNEKTINFGTEEEPELYNFIEIKSPEHVNTRRYMFQETGTDTYVNCGWAIPITKDISTSIYRTRIGFGIVRSSTIGTPFRWDLCAQLLDENYIMFKYGERLGYTSYPLHLLNTTYAYGRTVVNYLSNERAYFVNDSENGIDDKYLTFIQNRTLEQYPLFNDAYKQYYASNYSTMTRGIALAHQQEIYKGMKGIGEGMLQAGMGAAVTQVMPIKGSASATKGISGMITSATDALEGSYKIDEQLKITQENYSFTPDTTKQGNSLVLDELTQILTPFYSVAYVTDIEDCARRFESFGYKVHNTYFSTNLFYLNNRYYYDIVKTSNMEITLTDYISDSTTVALIKSRFSNGLRLWHTDNGVLRLDLGKVCYYDNVEQ